uniref:Uncharacterized protein n=1 Tax=Panagrolaimus sp. PS1159 TaxID=55785 RepID=A0AC35GPQ7_9BILA
MFCRKCHCMHDTRRCPIDSDIESDNDVSDDKTSKVLSKNRIYDEDSESESNEETDNDSLKYICCIEIDEGDHLPNKKCKKNKNCPGYFSTEHHAIFCSKRLEGSNFFFPRIDYDLIPRFLEIVSIEEKFIMILSSPIAERFIKFNPIKIEPEFLNTDDDDLLESDDIVIFNDEMTLQKSNLTKDEAFFDSLNAKIFLCFARRIEISESQLSAHAVLLLLSTYTRHFNFYETTCEPNLSFSDIIKTAPNLETIEIDGNIIFEKTWIEDFLKYKIGKNFYFLNIKLDILELDVINLVEFVKVCFF